MYDVVALGELLIDFIESGLSLQGNLELEANPGGAPCNVLSMLEHLGNKTAFIGKVGNDGFGRRLKEAIEEQGICSKGLLLDNEIHTTLAIVTKTSTGDRDFSFYRKPGADMMLKEEEVAEEKPLDAVVLSCDKGEVIQPVYGEVIPAAEIEDPMFAQETMGPSIGIRPKKGEVYAPFDGEVVMVFPTNHAIGLKSEGGIELLIHVGIDTVNMNGEGFESHVAAGDKINKGDLLLSFDIKKIKAAEHPDTTIVAITNAFDVKDVKKIK